MIINYYYGIFFIYELPKLVEGFNRNKFCYQSLYSSTCYCQNGNEMIIT